MSLLTKFGDHLLTHRLDGDFSAWWDLLCKEHRAVRALADIPTELILTDADLGFYFLDRCLVANFLYLSRRRCVHRHRFLLFLLVAVRSRVSHHRDDVLATVPWVLIVHHWLLLLLYIIILISTIEGKTYTHTRLAIAIALDSPDCTKCESLQQRSLVHPLSSCRHSLHPLYTQLAQVSNPWLSHGFYQ